MEIYRMRYFCAIARTGSMRKAAEILHVSPAALSKAVALLEQELSTKLILASGRGIVISDAGAKLAARLEPLLNELDRVGDEVRLGRSDAAPPLRLASFEVFTTWCLGPVVAKHFAGQTILVHEMLPGQMENAVAEGVADIGITYLPIPSPKVDHLKVASLEMGVYGRKGSFRNAKFEELPFAAPLSPVTGSPNKVRGLDGWPDDKVQRHVPYQVTLMETAMELCRQGLAVAYLPLPVVKCHNAMVKDTFSLAPLPFPKLPERAAKQSVYLIKRKSDAETALLKRVAAAIRIMSR